MLLREHFSESVEIMSLLSHAMLEPGLLALLELDSSSSFGFFEDSWVKYDTDSLNHLNQKRN